MVIADDAPPIRRMLAMVLTATDGLELVGEGENGAEAIELVRKLSPDALIIDHHMPVLDGLTAIRRLRADGLDVEIIVFSSDPTSEREAFAAGADAFFLKGEAGPLDLVDVLLGAPVGGRAGTIGHAVAMALADSRHATEQRAAARARREQASSSDS
ncbi:MAG: hypothetical protein NVS3B21_24430 [Acidimicrobiales bacterium]